MTSFDRNEYTVFFYRDTDRAMLGGVCAGLAGRLGINLRMTRILAFIAFLMAMPVAVACYVAAVLLLPAASGSRYRDSEAATAPRKCGFGRRSKRRQAAAELAEREHMDSERLRTANKFASVRVQERCKDLDERLIRLEARITSRQFQLDREISGL